VSDELELLVRRLRSQIEREESARRLDAQLRPRLLRYFQASSFSASEAEDLVQQALLRVFQHVGSLRAEERFLPWLFTIARNLARTAGGRRSREPDHGAEPLDPDRLNAGRGSEPGGEARARLARVEAAVRGLPEQQRRCLVLVARDELSYQEVADLLGLSPRTVRNHLALARRRLRSLLEGGEAG
jgi:RNA polymerase sigma-70 factor (ECF subfamily)